MAEKSKRLRKLLDKAGLKGQLKQVGSLDEAHIVLLINPACKSQLMFTGKVEYERASENGEIPLEEREVYFLVSTNPRNKWGNLLSLVSNKFGMEKRNY